MKRLLLAVILLAGLTDAALARTVEQQVLSSLQKQGYVVLEQGYTILGRLRIVAENGQIRREIVVNPGTGEILRDYAVRLPGKPEQAKPSAPASAPAAVTSASKPDSKPTAAPDRDDDAVATTTTTGAATTTDAGVGTAAGVSDGENSDDTATIGDAGAVTGPPVDDSVDPDSDQTEVMLPESLIQMAPGEP